MSLKKLNQFLKFDWEGFAKGKAFRVTGSKEWVDYTTKVHMGTKIEAVITKDDTPYKQKEGEQVTNAYEKLTFKVGKDMNIPAGTFVMPVGVTATVYGDYRNQLSVTADDIRILPVNK